MTDLNKILDKAKEIEAKMKESQENIKKIKAEGVSGSNSVKVILDGEGEMQKIEISDKLLEEEKSIIEDLIVAAHNNAKTDLKTKTKDEISKTTGGFGIPGFKWPLQIMQNIDEIDDLIKLISKLPGLGPKSAKRIVHLQIPEILFKNAFLKIINL